MHFIKRFIFCYLISVFILPTTIVGNTQAYLRATLASDELFFKNTPGDFSFSPDVKFITEFENTQFHDKLKINKQLLKSYNFTLFNAEVHGIPIEVSLTQATVFNCAYDMMRAARWILRSRNHDIEVFSDVTKREWASYFIKECKLQLPLTNSENDYYQTFNAQIRTLILHRYDLYVHKGFVEFIKSFPEYEQHVINAHSYKETIVREYLHGQLGLPESRQDKIIYDIIPALSQEATSAQLLRIQSAQEKRLHDVFLTTQEAVEKQALQERLAFQQKVIQQEADVPIELRHRNEAISQFLKGEGAALEAKQTSIDHQSAQLLVDYRVPSQFFEICHGNIVQQQLHNEFKELLRIAASEIHKKNFKHVLTENIIVGQELNHAGYTSEAYKFADFCHSIKEIACGAGRFTLGVAKGAWRSISGFASAVRHPIDTYYEAKSTIKSLRILINKFIAIRNDFMLEFITIETVLRFDTKLGTEKAVKFFEKYESKLRRVLLAVAEEVDKINTLEKAGEVVGNSVMSTYLCNRVAYVTKLAHRFAKLKILKVVKKIAKKSNSSPKVSAVANAGLELEAAAQVVRTENVLLNAAENIASECPPTCPVQANDLAKSLMQEELRSLKEQFTKVIKCTEHGLQRLIERGFTAEELLSMVTKPDFLRIQNDGAKVFISALENNKYNILVINESTGELISCFKNFSKKSMIDMGKNYGWTL